MNYFHFCLNKTSTGFASFNIFMQHAGSFVQIYSFKVLHSFFLFSFLPVEFLQTFF